MKSELVQPLNVMPRLAMRASPWRSPDHTASPYRLGAAGSSPAGLRVELRTEPTFSRTIDTDTLVLIHLPAGPSSAEVFCQDKSYSGSVLGEGILILPPDSMCKLTSSRPAQNLYLHIPFEEGEGPGIEPALVAGDETLETLMVFARSMLADDLDGSGAEEPVRRLSPMILTYLKRSYSSASFHMPASQRVRSDTPSADGSPLVTRAIEYMLDNIDRSITLDDIGRAVGRSAGQLGRLFKSRLGRSPYSYLLGLRIERARALLATTSMPIAELALECGFANQEHLTRHFRQLCDTTPAAYRRQHAWQVHQRAAS